MIEHTSKNQGFVTLEDLKRLFREWKDLFRNFSIKYKTD